MSELLTGYKTEIESALNDIFQTFRRSTPITFYKPSVEIIVAFDPAYNADLEEFNNPAITKATESQSFYCRIWYPKRENTLTSFIEGGANLQIKEKQELGIIRIQMEPDAYAYIAEAERFVFGNETYRMLTDPRKIGFLDEFKFYDVYFQKVN